MEVASVERLSAELLAKNVMEDKDPAATVEADTEFSTDAEEGNEAEVAAKEAATRAITLEKNAIERLKSAEKVRPRRRKLRKSTLIGT